MADKTALEAVRVQIRDVEEAIEGKRKEREQLIEGNWRPKTEEDGDRKWNKIYKLDEEIRLLCEKLFDYDREFDRLDQSSEAEVEDARRHPWNYEDDDYDE